MNSSDILLLDSYFYAIPLDVAHKRLRLLLSRDWTTCGHMCLDRVKSDDDHVTSDHPVLSGLGPFKVKLSVKCSSAHFSVFPLYILIGPPVVQQHNLKHNPNRKCHSKWLFFMLPGSLEMENTVRSTCDLCKPTCDLCKWLTKKKCVHTLSNAMRLFVQYRAICMWTHDHLTTLLYKLLP